MAETSRRIVEATVDLHTTVGPANTSISAIAERAGVQRHTVYAHFPDMQSLFGACSAHWQAHHPLPPLPAHDLRATLAALYGWYAGVEDAVVLLTRDSALYPEIWTERQRRFDGIADSQARSLGGGTLTRAAVGHALAFETWRSLTRDEGLSNRAAVEAMVAFVDAVGR
jgi:AcrR family transcriptional regulator